MSEHGTCYLPIHSVKFYHLVPWWPLFLLSVSKLKENPDAILKDFLLSSGMGLGH